MNAVDTNVLIYACDERDPARQRAALDLLDSVEGILLWQVACEFIAASRKLSPQGFSESDAWDNLDDFIDAFPLVTPSVAVLERARKLHVTQQCSCWDALIYAACVEAGVTTIYSEDLPGSPVPRLEVVNPFSGIPREPPS